MLRDRGLLKWQPAHFMPEHRKMLSDVDQDYYKQAKPQLDEQELEEIGIIVMESLNYTLEIKITIWQAGYFNDHIGIVSRVDYLMKYIFLEKEDENIKIMIVDITAVERN
ncbi:YolD-like family protein [Cytobacillus gottheilii]|uniref:YolD-like family protein n=1 Tax=Cytobacillus gottheilii TaxID=859144 RepID=A0ABX8FCP7_9BACI|nr:YolD-like family protein [Cytobacillus gottheilii]QVY60912.1 YolD-like family protein [Cytobacillus gottheilii]